MQSQAPNFSIPKFLWSTSVWFAVFAVAMAVVRYYPSGAPTTLALLLGVIMGMLTWRGVLAWHGYKGKSRSISTIILVAVAYVLRHSIAKTLTGHAFAVIVGAVSVLFFAFYITRGKLRHLDVNIPAG